MGSWNELYIIFFDLFNNYKNIKVRFYKYFFNDWNIAVLAIEIYVFIYNGVFSFTETVISESDSQNFFSIFLMFSHANGTDFEINIFLYLMDTGHYDASNNLFNDLITIMKIENNFFGCEEVDSIKLLSIFEELIFFNIMDDIGILNAAQ